MAKCSDPIRHKTCECDGTDDDGWLRDQQDAMILEVKVPQPGETFWDEVDGEYVGHSIVSVESSYTVDDAVDGPSDGGYEVICDNNVGYDCYWLEGVGWQYWGPA